METIWIFGFGLLSFDICREDPQAASYGGWGTDMPEKSGSPMQTQEETQKAEKMPEEVMEGLREIYYAGGCFWGVEAYFSRIPGVYDVTCGYANGSTENPTYEEVCSHMTGMPRQSMCCMTRTVSASGL